MESPGRLGDAGSEVSMSKQCRAYEVEVGQASRCYVFGNKYDCKGGDFILALVECTLDLLMSMRFSQMGN